MPIIKIIPIGVVCISAAEDVTLLTIRYIIPQKLNITPPIFCVERGSFRAMAAINIVYIGDIELTIEQSIGVMLFMATKKNICVRKKPKNEAIKIFGKSCLSIFSFGVNRDIIQNIIPAPMERRENRAIGEIAWLLVKSLQSTIFRPKMVYAAQQAKWPKIEL